MTPLPVVDKDGRWTITAYCSHDVNLDTLTTWQHYNNTTSFGHTVHQTP